MSSSALSLFGVIYTVGEQVVPNGSGSRSAPSRLGLHRSVRSVAATVGMERVDGESMSFVLIGTIDSKE